MYGKCHHCCKKPYLCPDLQPVCFHKEGFVVNKCNIDKSLRHGTEQYEMTVLSALYCSKTRHIRTTLYTAHVLQNTAQHSTPDASLPKRRIAEPLSLPVVFFCLLFSCIFEHPMVDSVNNRPAPYPVFSVTDGRTNINPVNKLLTINLFCPNDTVVHP